MKIFKALCCKLSVHHWTLWMVNSELSYHLVYTCARCGARRNIP